MVAETAGYSGTPLAKKLGLKAGMRVRLIQAPDHYWDLLGDAALDPEQRREAAADETAEVDFVHLFATERDALERGFAAARASMSVDGMVWASWPKKSSGVPTEIAKGDVMATGKAVGLVDVKVCAVDETWSGLKFVIPVADR